MCCDEWSIRRAMESEVNKISSEYIFYTFSWSKAPALRIHSSGSTRVGR
jgi:hypothetical protein